jgi:hypothetical protein
MGVRNRLRTMEFDCAFVAEPNREFNQRAVDTTIKTRFKTDTDYQDAFMHLVLDAYREFCRTGLHVDPPGLAEATEDNVADGVDFKSRLLKYFDLNQDPKEFATAEEISNVLHKDDKKAKKMNKGDVKRAMMEIFIKQSTNCGRTKDQAGQRGYPGVRRNNAPDPGACS